MTWQMTNAPEKETPKLLPSEYMDALFGMKVLYSQLLPKNKILFIRKDDMPKFLHCLDCSNLTLMDLGITDEEWMQKVHWSEDF